MFKTILFALSITTLSGLMNPVVAQKKKQGSKTAVKTEVKFLEDISVEPASAAVSAEPLLALKQNPTEGQFAASGKEKETSTVNLESAPQLQFKYALLLDTEVEMVQNIPLFRLIDEWFGTRYRLGGTTKSGIDCSALMQVFFSGIYGITLPRTAKEQYNFSSRISRTELKEGDLIFFNTIGGVSHVGMYLQNNKFIHASSGGVTISDLYEDYWMKRFIGVGRVEGVASATASVSKP
ncbi:MAG TPA: C40 family peptidase [Flavisolibacter sp.]|nr:C40 family peptidase [Flavisolibacter sp.]